MERPGTRSEMGEERVERRRWTQLGWVEFSVRGSGDSSETRVVKGSLFFFFFFYVSCFLLTFLFLKIFIFIHTYLFG